MRRVECNMKCNIGAAPLVYIIYYIYRATTVALYKLLIIKF